MTFATNEKKCYLKNILDSTITIPLEDKEEITLGRCQETNIKDKRCSRNQVSLSADFETDTVRVQHLGGNPSTANGIILRSESHTLKHGEILEFLVGEYKFKVEFDPSPDYGSKLKRKSADTDDECQEKDSEQCIKKSCNVTNDTLRGKPCQTNLWEKLEDGKLYVLTTAGVQSASKIAAYDLDGTIILTKSGRVFPKDKDDWMLANGAVKSKITKVLTDGYKVVILTNQAGIGRGKTNVKEFKQKVENIISALNIPLQVFISATNSIYRKPAPGMWTYLENKKNDGLKIDMKSSFYVGDAAGRIANWAPKKKKDFSCADRLMAMNLKLQFYTPEEHFLNQPPGKFVLPMFDPSSLDKNTPLADGEIVNKSQEVVLMVGYPGSGKSNFVTRHLVPAGYTHVNRDTLGSWQKCVLNMESALAAGRSVVIDNTNPDRESRRRFLERANVPCRCFLMTTSLDHVRHNNKFREFTDTKHIPVNDMIINSYKSKFEEPSLQEGFTEIVKVNFVPFFSDPELEKLYRMHLVEK